MLITTWRQLREHLDKTIPPNAEVDFIDMHLPVEEEQISVVFRNGKRTVKVYSWTGPQSQLEKVLHG